MQSEISICGAGAVGIFLAHTANIVGRTSVKLHSLRRGRSFNRLKVETPGLDVSSANIRIQAVENISDVVLLACDIASIDVYLSEIAKVRRGQVTYVYLMQNGLLGSACTPKDDGLVLNRISIGGVSLHLEGDILRCSGNKRPFLDISREENKICLSDGKMLLKTLEAIGDVVIRSRECEVVWNKLVRSGPHFLDTLINFDPSIKMGIEQRLAIARLLFNEYWDIAAIACENKLSSRTESLSLVEKLVSKGVVNSGAKRYINSSSNEEYESLVGRVKDYALDQGLQVTTLSFVEQLTRKK